MAQMTMVDNIPPPSEGGGQGVGGIDESMTAQPSKTLHRIKPFMRELARKLRREPSYPERVLWYALRKKQVDGMQFRRQAVIGKFIVDFACPERKLIVEVDGESHVGRVETDQDRTAFLESQGFRVLRVTNDEVLRDLESVVLLILREASAPPTPLPPPFEGGGVVRRKGVE